MDHIFQTLRLLQRHAELERAMRRPGGIRITDERELLALKAQLEKFPTAVRAVLETAHSLRRPVDALSVEDIEKAEAGVH
jgi:hypothetical protein